MVKLYLDASMRIFLFPTDFLWRINLDIHKLTTFAKFCRLQIRESCVWVCNFFLSCISLPVKNTNASVIQKYKKMPFLLLKLRHLPSKDSTVLVQKTIAKQLKKKNLLATNMAKPFNLVIHTWEHTFPEELPALQTSNKHTQKGWCTNTRNCIREIRPTLQEKEHAVTFLSKISLTLSCNLTYLKIAKQEGKNHIKLLLKWTE